MAASKDHDGVDDCEPKNVELSDDQSDPLLPFLSGNGKLSNIREKEERSLRSAEEIAIIQKHSTNSTMTLQNEVDCKTDNEKGCLNCNHMKSSTHWTQVEPYMSKENQISVYTLKSSEEGHYQCSVSGLRWVCENNVELKYKFKSWDHQRATLWKMHLEEAGPFLDITVVCGKLEEIQLPHFVCIEPSYPQSFLRESMKVIHVKDNKVVVEEVDEVTSSHAKLLHPTFSGRGLIVKPQLFWRVHCNVLIFRQTRAMLTLHTYLIRCDPSLEVYIEEKAKSYGFVRLPKPKPETSQRFGCQFRLKTSCLSSITPEIITFRKRMPNYFEVYIRDAAVDFEMKLISEKGQCVWKAEIRTAEYRDDEEIIREVEFVDKYRTDLINRVNNVSAIADILLSKRMISKEIYENINAAHTRHDKMRTVYEALTSGGDKVKSVFFNALKEIEPFLIEDLSHPRQQP